MRVWLWKSIARFLSFQTFVQAIVGLVTIGGTMLVMMLIGYHIRWPLLPVFVAFYSTIGVGIDLQARSFGNALLLGSLVSIALAFLMLIVANVVVRALGKGSFELPMLEGLEIYAPLFLLMALSMRWCVRSEARKAFVRGTARFNRSDSEKRKAEVAKFKGEHQG